MPFNIALYNSGMFRLANDSPVPAATYAITVTGTSVTSGMDIDITIRNLTTGNVAALKYSINCGWGVSGVDVAPTGIFLADMSWKNRPMGNYIDGTRSYQWGTSSFSTGNPTDGGLNIPAMVMHASTRAIGISTNYPYTHNFITTMISGTTYGVGSVMDLQTGLEKVNDHLGSGESINWKIWLREASGYPITTGNSLSLIQPYTNWFTTNWPDQRPPRVSGRIYGLICAQTEGLGPRNYNIVSGMYPSSGNVDWNQMFSDYALPSPAALKARGYNGICFWALGGHVASEDFRTNVFDAMPDNLKKTLYQVNDWSRTNDLSVYAYIGDAYLYYQASGNYNDPFLRMESQFNGLVGSGYSLATAVKYSINPTGYLISKRNIDNGCLVWFDGVGLDAMPDVVARPYLTGVLQSIRNERPRKIIFSEAYKTPQTQSYVPCTYYPSTKWDGLRCAWMETVFPNYQNFALVNPSEFANSGLYLAEIARCEAGGLCVITLAGPSSFSLLTPITIPKITEQDKKSQGSRPRGVR